MFSLTGWWLGIISYALCHCGHVIVWRLRPIQHDVRVLLFLYFVPPLAVIFLCDNYGIAALITHYTLAANYLAIYPAFQASSPTVTILYAIYEKPEGIGRDGIAAQMGTQSLIGDRIEDLVTAGLVEKEKEALTLTRSGKMLADLFICYRRVLGLPQGAG